jgi:hypothetical protein
MVSVISAAPSWRAARADTGSAKNIHARPPFAARDGFGVMFLGFLA